MDGPQRLDHCLAGVGLQRPVLVVALGEVLGRPTGDGGLDLEEQVGDAGLGLGVVADLGLGVGHGALELLHDRARFVEQVDQPGGGRRGLRHLRRRILEIHDPRPGLGHDGSGDHERVCVPVVEPDRDVSGYFDVLALILADRYLLRVVEQDVGGLERGVGEEAGGHEIALPLGRLLLERRHPRQLSEADHALHHPGELGVLGYVRLNEDRGDLGVEADGEQCSAASSIVIVPMAPGSSTLVIACRSTMP